MGYFAEEDLKNNPYVDHCQMCNIYSEDLEEVIVNQDSAWICPDCLKFLKRFLEKKHKDK